jgi:hypothetical protein
LVFCSPKLRPEIGIFGNEYREYGSHQRNKRNAVREVDVDLSSAVKHRARSKYQRIEDAIGKSKRQWQESLST